MARNQAVITFATFIGFASFTLVMPFLPLYIRQLGVTDVGEIALWSGVSLGVTPAMTALFAPLWGRLADRFGRKIMVQRSLVSFTVTFAAMAFATRPWHIVALRVVQGFFAGYGAISLAMATESAPPARLASTVGAVQTSQRLGPALGPVIGGTLAQLFGLRAAFLIAAACYAMAFVLILLLYKESPAVSDGTPVSQDVALSIGALLKMPGMLLGMACVFGLQYVDRSYGPILPLYVAQVGVEPARVALMSGILFSVSAAAGAAGHMLGARLARAPAVRAQVASGLAMGGAAAVALGLVTRPPALMVAMAGLGLAIGLGLTVVYAVAARTLPPAAYATGFGLFSSAGLTAVAISPMTSALVGAVSIRGVFFLDAAVLVVLAAAIYKGFGGTHPGRARVVRSAE